MGDRDEPCDAVPVPLPVTLGVPVRELEYVGVTVRVPDSVLEGERVRDGEGEGVCPSQRKTKEKRRKTNIGIVILLWLCVVSDT